MPLLDTRRTDAVAPSTDKRTQLLVAAAATIVTRGYEAVRLRDIARESGVSTGMIQYYFESRDELLTAAFEHAVIEQIATWTRISNAQDDPWRRLLSLLDLISGELTSVEQCIIWTELCSCAARHEHLRPLVRTIYREWETLLAAAVRAGVERGVFQLRLPEADVTSALVAIIDGVEVAIASRSDCITTQRARDLVHSIATHLVNPM
jgi:AcrR family transcriptional regulator